MNKHLRPIPYPIGSEARRKWIGFCMTMGMTYYNALHEVATANRQARNKPLRGEKCEAKTRKGTPCQCKALANGRCKYHGGKSTGPRTEEGTKRAAANLRKC